MGTAISLDLRQPWVLDHSVDAFFDWLRSVDERFSTYRESSIVSRLRRGEMAVEDVDQDVSEVLDLCADVHRCSHGVFDVWRHSPAGVDPSGLVKGWSIDRGAQILEAAGARNFCINAGGDVLVRGKPSPGACWRIGVRHPVQANLLSAILEVEDMAVATSGSYERGQHIVDPRAVIPPTELLSMTVAGPSLAFADAYATAAFAMGEAGVAWMATLPRFSGFAATARHRARWTADFHRLFRAIP